LPRDQFFADYVYCRFHPAGESLKHISKRRRAPKTMQEKPAFPAGNSRYRSTSSVKFDSMDEHRIATRHRVLKAGTIEFGGGAIDCTVRNISATGAALDVTSPVGIPAQFTLVTDGSQLPCHVVWRKEKRIGVTFDRKP
jgi:hypothetical protein